jgi:hypothetical protein
MIEMQVRVNHDIDVVGFYSVRREPIEKPWAFPNRVDIPQLRIQLISGAGLDEYRDPASSNQHAVHAKLDPVPLVRRDALFPERLRHNSKHRAAIKAKSSIAHDREFQIAQPHVDSPIPALARISFTAE